MPPKSLVWKHFNKISSSLATCRHCEKTLKTGNTSNMKCHLEAKHSKLLTKSTCTQPSTSVSPPEDTNTVGSDISSKSKDKRVDENTSDVKPISTSTSNQDEIDISPAPTSRSFVQKTISSTMKKIQSFKSGGSANEKITQSIFYMICKDCEPFKIVEREGFKQLLKTIAPHYSLPSRYTLKRMLISKYDAVASKMRAKLSGKNCTLTTDVWTDCQTRSFMSLTVHFYDPDVGEMVNNSLGICLLEESHTGEYLANQLQKMCNEWGIESDSITAVVTDNGANIKKAVDISFGSKKQVPCFAHTLNLVAQRSMENSPKASALITQIKQIVAWFKQSVVAADTLREVSEKKLLQSVPTRWNSTFAMLERFLELRRHVGDILGDKINAPAMLGPRQLLELTEICQVLQPLENATNEISGDHYVTSSMAIPIASLTLEGLKSINPSHPVAKELLEQVLSEFSRRFGKIEQVNLLGLATLLDPRFKKGYFKDPLAISRHIAQVNNLIKKHDQLLQDNSSSTPESETEAATSAGSTKRKSLFSRHNRDIQTKWRKHEENVERLHKELSLYLGAPAEKIQQNQIHFWVQMATTYPIMSQIAMIYLTTVATSVPSERMFSRAGNIVTDSRNRLKGKLIEKLLFLHDADDKLWF